MKFSKSVCEALVASLTKEMAQHEVLLTMLMEHHTVTNSAVIHRLCAMALNLLAHVRPHDDKSSNKLLCRTSLTTLKFVHLHSSIDK